MNKRITSAFREFILILILFISLPSFILAQALYPVTAILDVQGPYSPVFSTFSDPSNQAFRPNKMALRLRLNDLNEASLAVRLKWEISGPGIEFQTNDDFLGGIANLISGQYITLDNAALTPYFDLFGSSGISDEFVTGTGGYLPEGSYSFCVTAFELIKGQQVSNTSCREIYIEEYEPPFLNNPSGSITPTFPQNLQISWTPRHFGVFPVIYNVKIWETFEGLTPDQVVSSQMPYITLDVNQVTQTFLNSQNGLLTPGRSYLAQVQIRDGVNGPFGMPSVIFKNNGNSEVLAFTYGEDDPEGVCTAPLEFKSELDDQQNVVLFWQESDPTLAPTLGRSTQVAYQIKYREVGITEWQIKETSVRTLLMTGLRQGETYEIELYKVCLNGLTAGGALKVLVPKRNKARTLPDCGEEMDISGMSEVPLERLAVNDTIFASGTEVIVQEVAGSGGVFTGKGFIRLPLLSTVKIAVEFDAISVNEDFELTAGEIRTVYNPLAGNVANINFGSDNLTDFPTLEYQDSFKIISLTADGTLIYLDGREVLVNGAYIKGKGLNEFVFSGERFDVFEEYEKFDSLGPVRVKFAASGNQRFGFDAYKPAIDKEYEKYFDLPVSYKSVAEGAFDEVEVFVEGGLEEGDTIVFVDELTKAELQFLPKGVSTKYRVNAMGPGRPSAIIAYVINKGVAGKLNIYSTPITKVPIKIVNVNGVSGNSAGVESTINKIFAPGLFKVEVLGQDDFDYVEKEDGIINVENHFLNAYSPDMKKLADEYFKTKGQLDETFYLFISDKLEASTQGLMPQGYAAGFISSTASAQVYAHELAHGIFNFDHSWLMYGLDSMKTQNLMDYSGGTELWYRQWKQMVSPGFPKGWRKDEKDGSQLSAGNLDYQCIKGSALAKLVAAGLTFFDFGGNPVELKTEEQPYAFVSPSEGATYEGRIGIIRKGDKIYGPSIDFKEDKVKTPIWTGVYANFNFSSDTISLKKSSKTAVKVIIDKDELLIAGDLRIEHATEKCPISSENKEGISDVAILNDLEIFKILTEGQTLNESEQQKVYDFIQYVKSLIAGRTAFFVEYNADEKLYAQQPQDNAFWEFLRDKKLTPQTEFDKVFKSYDRSGKDFDKIVSNVDLWGDTPSKYCNNSYDFKSYPIDWGSESPEDYIIKLYEIESIASQISEHQAIAEKAKNDIEYLINDGELKNILTKQRILSYYAALGFFDRYEYNIKELILRKYHLTSQQKVFVLMIENRGQAIPLTLESQYEQHVAKYNDNSALLLGLEYLEMLTDLIEVNTISEMLTPAFKALSSKVRQVKPLIDFASIIKRIGFKLFHKFKYYPSLLKLDPAILQKLADRKLNDDILRNLDWIIKENVGFSNVLNDDDLFKTWYSLTGKGLSNDLINNVGNIEALNKALKQEDFDEAYFVNLLKKKENPQDFIDKFVTQVGNDGKFVDRESEILYLDYVNNAVKNSETRIDRTYWKSNFQDLEAYLKSKGFSLFDEVDGSVFFRDANNRIAKIIDKNKPDNIIWFTPITGNTWPTHELNVTNYLKFKYGNNVATQVKVRTYHKNGQTIDGFLDDIVETSSGEILIIDAKHSQKAQIVDGKIPGYTTGQTQTYQWITDGDAVKIEIIGDGANNIIGLGRNIDILPRLKGKIGIITNDSNGQLVELSVYKTNK
ncbi:MAG: fibronectin type III domain-containing protein [Saprospiraceae bacterium]|nr:fibronectin type III domain-containing protein [Saprospiraceae bacterium]